jgi:hypothetical protein
MDSEGNLHEEGSGDICAWTNYRKLLSAIANQTVENILYE